LMHAGASGRQLMHYTPTNENIAKIQPFLDTTQMNYDHCKKYSVKLDNNDRLTLDNLFYNSVKRLHNTNVPRQNDDSMISNLMGKCLHQKSHCKCGLDGLEGCYSKTKKVNKKPLVLRRIANHVKCKSGKVDCSDDVVTPKPTKKKPTKKKPTKQKPTTQKPKTQKPTKQKLKPNGVKCDLKIQGLKGKSRFGVTTTYPDLYYMILVDEKNVADSEKEVIHNQLNAEWSFTLPNHFKGNEKISVLFYDQDRGRDSIVNKDDLIGSATFEAKKFSETKDCDEQPGDKDKKEEDERKKEEDDCDELEILDEGEDDSYRKPEAAYMMNCVNEFIKD